MASIEEDNLRIVSSSICMLGVLARMYAEDELIAMVLLFEEAWTGGNLASPELAERLDFVRAATRERCE